MNTFMQATKQIAIFSLLVVMATGCARERPIYQVENHPVPQHAPSLSLEQIEQSIIKAGKETHWRIGKLESGRMQGFISWRKHSATVTIEYDQRFFSIRYKSSQNLFEKIASDEEPYSGQQVIHRKYNGHVRKLEQAIDNELAFARS
jgi:hypothetical protein